MDNIVLEEANILSRNYSTLRINTKKWRIFSRNEKVNETIQYIKEPGFTVLAISRDGNSVDGFKANTLYKRGLLRRNYSLFKTIQHLWEFINPFNFSGISEKVYTKLYTVIYKIALKDTLDDAQIDKFINVDKKVDFSGKS